MSLPCVCGEAEIDLIPGWTKSLSKHDVHLKTVLVVAGDVLTRYIMLLPSG